MTADNTHRERLAGLQPGTRARITALLDRMVEIGKTQPWRPVVTSGFRSPAAQEQLFKKGREPRVERVGDKVTTRWVPGGPERIVTKARCWESAHCFGLAADIALVDDETSAWVRDGDEGWLRLHDEAAALGLETGHLWRFVDSAHVQEPAWQATVRDEIEAMERRFGP